MFEAWRKLLADAGDKARIDNRRIREAGRGMDVARRVLQPRRLRFVNRHSLQTFRSGLQTPTGLKLPQKRLIP